MYMLLPLSLTVPLSYEPASNLPGHPCHLAYIRATFGVRSRNLREIVIRQTSRFLDVLSQEQEEGSQP